MEEGEAMRLTLAEAARLGVRLNASGFSQKSKITIAGTLPSLNEYTNTARKNKYASATMKRRYTGLCAQAANASGGRHRKVHIEFHWIEPNRKRDKDNICFAKKFCIDGLVEAGVIPNDGWKNVDSFSDRFSVDKNYPRIEITINEIQQPEATSS